MSFFIISGSMLCKFNDHIRCYISTTMSEEQADICLRNGTYRDSLLIRKSTEQGNEYLFAGGISNIDIQVEDGIPHVTRETTQADRELVESLRKKYITGEKRNVAAATGKIDADEIDLEDAIKK
ncbi:hypothetical protein [Paenibacillus lautus]|uniref:hypothetical protein n=1 Tax=Paenibacillus lautus TaxID=1401 RepID=UPI003D2DBBA1